ncbi:MAG: S1 RNA-binding domain-containing protein [Myxococcaceae bacterium]
MSDEKNAASPSDTPSPTAVSNGVPPTKRTAGPMVVVRRAVPPVPATPKPEGKQEAVVLPSAAAGADAAAPGAVAMSEAAIAAPAGATTVAPAPPRTGVFDEVEEKESFAELLETQSKSDAVSARRLPRVGERVSGKIFQLGAEMVFVSLGGRSEAMIPLRELTDEEGILRFGVGDVVEAHVVEAGARGVTLSRALPKGSTSMSGLIDARASGIPVDGLVLSLKKGGFEVAVGDVRAFCPMSQMDLRFVDKPEEYIGERFHFRVIEARERNVVLSRRALLEAEQKAKAEETRKNLVQGAVLKGQVSGVREFGAFVDLGGVEALIPTSELSHARVHHPSEVVKAGDVVEVEILRIEPGEPNSPDKAKRKERITLSMRSRQADPWKEVADSLNEGDKLSGKVVRLQPFGAFVEIKPGVDGLVHISALSNRRIAHPKDVVKVGDTIEVVVQRVDRDEKRIALRRVVEGETAPVQAEGDGVAPAAKAPTPSAPRPKSGQVVTGVVERIEPFGVFVEFPGGRGMIPASETGTDRGADLKRIFKLGQEVKAAIIEIAAGKTRLSIPAAARVEERAEVEAWKRTQSKGSGKGFGTLGDLLKGKVGG